MELHPNKKKIRRIIRLNRSDSGGLVAETLWKPKKKKKRTSSELRPADRMVRSTAKAYRAFGDTLIKRHRRSNKKKKNGGLKDLGRNIFRASRRANKASR